MCVSKFLPGRSWAILAVKTRLAPSPSLTCVFCENAVDIVDFACNV